MMKKITVATVILATAFLSFYFSTLQRPTISFQQFLALNQQYQVRILRDKWGVPHLFGKRDADVAFGLAFAHAEDDFATIQGSLLAARGRLAEVYGRDAAPNDYMVHLFRVQKWVDEKYDTDLSPATRALCEGYANGLNYFAALHQSEALAELYPITGEDIVASFVHKVPLFFEIDKVLRQLFDSDHPPAGSVLPTATGGSNTIAVSPRRTANGQTFLAINSHQPWEGPVSWYEAHLHSEEGWDMVGGVFPGAPVILHGHNRFLGWAHTVNQPDVLDVYALEINPDNSNQYRYDGEWRNFETSSAAIRVKLLGPLFWTFEKELLWSIHGPVVRQPHGTYAIRYAGYGDIRQAEQWYRMNKARTFEEWQTALRLQALPVFNCAYADHKGNIYYLYNALLPARAEGYDWQQLLPGNTSATRWNEYIPFDQLPHVFNPKSGFIQNCNSSPFQTTIGEDNPAPQHFPRRYGIEKTMTNRALRALELLSGDSSISEDEFITYKFDMRYSTHSKMASFVERVLNASQRVGMQAAEPVALLRSWDLSTDPENRAAALAVLSFGAYLRPGAFAPTDSQLIVSVEAAAKLLQRHHGGLEVPWRQVNRLRRGAVDLGLGGGPDVLHAVDGDLQEDGRIRGTVGDSYILLVTWDRDGKVSSQSVHQYGSATLDPDSPHYADQARLFVKRHLKPVWMSEAQIRANLAKEYRPGEKRVSRKAETAVK